MNLLYELFDGLQRGGPGSNEYTKKAYHMLDHVPECPRILDIGCGKGIQTLELARLSNGHVIALDNHQTFLDELYKTAKKEELSNNIELKLGNMFKLSFPNESFDIIWSEGAIYIMGFEPGLKAWRRFLIPNGYLVVTELSWFKPSPPEALMEFWLGEYPGIKSIDENLAIIENTGFRDVGHFNLPDQVWWDSLYTPMGKRVNELKIKYDGHAQAKKIFDEFMNEIRIFKQYSEWYGYTFYIMQKDD